MDKYQELSEKLLECMGGIENITNVAHCATRLRISYKNKELIDEETLKVLPDSSGIVKKAGTIQIIVGPDVHDAYNKFVEVSGWKSNGNYYVEDSEEEEEGETVSIRDEKRDFQYYLMKFSNFIAPAGNSGAYYRRHDSGHQKSACKLFWCLCRQWNCPVDAEYFRCSF